MTEDIISGIYCIKNTKDNKIYVGSAFNIKNRWKRHFSQLNKNISPCKYLQEAWNKYGQENFIFYVLEYVEKEFLKDREIFYILDLGSHYTENGYNISWGGSSPMLGRKHSDESRQKISENNPNKTGNINPMQGKKQSPETRKKISENYVGMTGKTHTEETKEKIRKSKTGSKLSDETKEKMRKAQQKRRLDGKNNQE